MMSYNFILLTAFDTLNVAYSLHPIEMINRMFLT